MVDSSATPLIAPVAYDRINNNDNNNDNNDDDDDDDNNNNNTAPPVTFAAMPPRRPSSQVTGMLVASGVLDWVIIVAAAVGGYYLGDITPNKRPFQLENPDISFPYTVNETVTTGELVVATVVVPVVVIFLVSIFTTPGLTVPAGTPARLVWRRKLWEFYASLLSFALGYVAQWFIVNGLKNVCGKPRPDLIARCQPDLAHLSDYIVGGIANVTSNGQLVSASICQNTDSSILDDGFRSYPSGHSGSSAAGLGHLALFLAYKLGVVFPYAARPAYDNAAALSAFPSRTSALSSSSSASSAQRDVYELADRRRGGGRGSEASGPSKGFDAPAGTQTPFAVRRSGAAPPLYLLLIVLVPLGGSFFIAASRWYNFRHHGFDILFGYSIGTVTSIIAFRLYQLPMSRGAGWAWGPRSPDKAFWSGIGDQSWAVPREQWLYPAGDVESGRGMAVPVDNYRPVLSEQSVTH